MRKNILSGENSRQHKLEVDLPQFSKAQSANINIPDLGPPISYFELIMDDDIFQYICNMTEKHFQLRNPKRASSHKKKWETPDINSMKCFSVFLFTWA